MQSRYFLCQQKSARRSTRRHEVAQSRELRYTISQIARYRARPELHDQFLRVAWETETEFTELLRSIKRKHPAIAPLIDRLIGVARSISKPCATEHRLLAVGPTGKMPVGPTAKIDRKSTRLNSSHVSTSYAVFCLNKK